jgi:arylformamidase
MSRYVLLSYTIDDRTPLYGNTPAPIVISYSSISAGSSSNTYILKIHNHTGTHVDAPGHFITGGKTISEYDLRDVVFQNPVIVECPAGEDEKIPLKNVLSGSISIDCLLVRTGFSRYRQEEIYSTHNPWFSSEDISWLRKNYPSIRCLGVDSISISGFQNREEGRKAHKAAFVDMIGAEPLLLIEDMNLSPISGQRLKKILVLPLMIKGIDSAPCSVIAEVE